MPRNAATQAPPMPTAPSLLHEYFERSAAAFPTLAALRIPSPDPSGHSASDAALELSYQALNQRADGLAARLQPGEVVAIAIARDRPEAYVALLAVLKSGSSYTYLDPSFPIERQARIVADAGIRTVLCEPQFEATGFPDVVLLPSDRWEASTDPAHKTPQETSPSSLAYIIYTSGTTGEPKGVLIEHRSVCNLIESNIALFDLGVSDRIAQGSSLAYDSSVEEIWMAWSVGACVVVMHDDAVRLGPDLVPWLRQNAVSVICPTPTLLRTMGVADPATELPDLNLIYIGGEALTQDLVDLWAPSKWLENGYGPTECTVTVVRGRMRVGQPITIGKAVAGNEALIIDPHGNEVAEGQEGELCIRGVGLARGYHQRAELTAEKFEPHAKLGRIYHTGDRVQRDADGNLLYLGRLDSQVKLRGYRIELQEIETRLQTFEGIRESACAILGQGSTALLVAAIVPTGVPTEVRAIQEKLRAQVPEYMVPARIYWVDSLPTNVSGKLDRTALAKHALQLQRELSEPVTGQGDREPTDLEHVILQAMAAALPPGIQPSLQADFFLDLGGDSLGAATLISDLRRNADTARLTVRNVYEFRTAQRLAQCLLEAQPPAPIRPGTDRVQLPPASSLNPAWATIFQTVWLCASAAAVLVALYALAFWALPKALLQLGLWPTVLTLALVGPALPWLWLFPSVALTNLAKRCLIGKYEPGHVPAWSALYVRHWIVQRLSAMIPWGFLQGTVWHAMVLRSLGAKIGKDVHLHRGVSFPLGGWDLLEISDGVMLCQDAQVRVVEWHAGHLMLDRISIGSGCTVGVRAGLSPGAVMEEGAFLSDHAWLPGTGHQTAGERWDGIPAKPMGPAPLAPDSQGTELGPVAHGFALILARAAITNALGLPWLLALGVVLWFGAWSGQDVVDWLYGTPLSTAALWAGIAALMVPVSLLLRALALRCMGSIAAGTYPLRSWPSIKAWIKTEQVDRAGLWISGSLFWPPWLRATGMKIGANSEISTIVDCVPERVEIGKETFFADGIYLAPPLLHRGTLTIADTVIGQRTFLGNHSVIPTGHHMADGILLGVSTVADEKRMGEGTSWFGHPSFELPQRQIIEMERALTHDPGVLRFMRRLLWEVARVLLPTIPTVLALAWFQWSSLAVQADGLGARECLSFVGITLGLAACLPIFVWILKWCLIGKVRAGRHGLWSGWCCRWDFLYVSWNFYARPILSTLEGTTLLAWYLRAMGSKIGKRVVLGGAFAQVVDPDMLNFEDGSTVSGIFQAHTFEDRVLKIAPLHLRKDSTLSASALMFYGADMGPGCHVAPQSVIMKEEHLTGRERYAGSPSQPEGN
ncbi:MAG: non-ribosomal peptide synthetase-like protein [Glaciecola sp.]|jgi:non-ribosomal peptide synthetase-like protein